jgi:hypothetical protein
MEMGLVQPQLELHPYDGAVSLFFFLAQETMHREETRMTPIQRQGFKNPDPMDR